MGVKVAGKESAMARVRVEIDARFDASVDVAIVGAGAAGLVAALRARESGAEVLILERDALPSGSTALSAGLIPAAATRFQAAARIEDSPEAFAADILAKAHGEPDPRRRGPARAHHRSSRRMAGGPAWAPVLGHRRLHLSRPLGPPDARPAQPLRP